MRGGLTVLIAAAVMLPMPAMAQVKNKPQSAMEKAAAARDDIEWVYSADPDINAAIAEAQDTMPEFLTALSDPESFNITFKFPLSGYEHIWVTNVRRDGDVLTGTLDNVPVQPDWAKGDAVRVPFADISDYFYCDADARPHGHYTTRVLYDRDRGAGFFVGVMPILCETKVTQNVGG